MIPLLIYIIIFVVAFFGVQFLARNMQRSDYTSLKTVTFGDESAVESNRIASVISVISIFVLWGAFTGSSLLPGFLHMPGPFIGETSFEYTVTSNDGSSDTANVQVIVHPRDQKPETPEIELGDGFAKNDLVVTPVWRSKLAQVQNNDEVAKADGKVTAINGKAISPGASVDVEMDLSA